MPVGGTSEHITESGVESNAGYRRSVFGCNPNRGLHGNPVGIGSGAGTGTGTGTSASSFHNHHLNVTVRSRAWHTGIPKHKHMPGFAAHNHEFACIWLGGDEGCADRVGYVGRPNWACVWYDNARSVIGGCGGSLGLKVGSIEYLSSTVGVNLPMSVQQPQRALPSRAD